MLKDNLREVIVVKGGVNFYIECESIFELIWNWYMDYADGLEEKTDITYRGIMLDIIYDVTTDENGEVIEETDFITIRKVLQDQINSINEVFDKKDGE